MTGCCREYVSKSSNGKTKIENAANFHWINDQVINITTTNEKQCIDGEKKQYFAEHLILNSFLYAEYALINLIPLGVYILFPFTLMDLLSLLGLLW